MALWDRLCGFQDPRVPVHQFMAALGEVERGKMTEAEVATAFNLDAGEQSELSALVAKIVWPQETVCIGGSQTLTNVGAAYDTVNVGGVALVQLVGITRVTFGVRANKVGGGTQNWQLWRTDTDGTNGVEVSVISDVRRVSRLSSVELHEVLCLGESHGYVPYETVAKVKARLGIA